MLKRLTEVFRAMEAMPKTRIQMMVPTYWPVVVGGWGGQGSAGQV
jgi:hypothetical protein